MSEKSKTAFSEETDPTARPWWYRGIVATRAKDCIVWDTEGRSFIDCTSSFFVMNVGHNHPEVVEELKRAADNLTHVPVIQATPQGIKLSKKLAAIAPVKGSERKVYFTVTGSEAIEASIRAARGYTGKAGLVSFHGSYHGWTYGAVSLSGLKAFRKNAGPTMPGVLQVPPPYCYRCPYDTTYPGCNLLCARVVRDLIAAEPEQYAGIVTEPILGAGGCIAPPDGWMREMRKTCDDYGLLFVADEVQTGFGRSGRMFAVEHENVKPDVVALSKAMGGGIPLGASVGRKEVIDGIQVPTPPTFACHALACAAGLKALEILERDRLWENAARRGEYFLKRFTELKQYHPLIGDVRFKGLMGGVELVKDQKTKQPAVDESKKIVKKCIEHGVLTMVAGLTGSVMRIQPPLTVSEEHAEMVVDAFDKALAAVEQGQE